MSKSFMDEFCGSTFWNSSITWETSYPNFTSCFRKTVLLWIPCVYLWLFAGLEIYFFKNSSRKNIPNNCTNVTKLLINIGLIFLVIIETVINFNTTYIKVYDVDIYSPVIKLLSLILAFALGMGNKKYGMHTSGLLFLFWLLMSVCGIPELSIQISNLFNSQENSASENSNFPEIIGIISYLLILMMLILNIVTDKPVTDSKSAVISNPCPEETASFLSKQFFLWFDSFAIKSVRNPLDFKDLWDLNEKNCSRYVVPIFEKHWLKIVSKTNRKSKKQASFLPALLKTFGIAFVSGTMFKVGQDLLTFVNPQILSLFITFVKEKQENWKGIMYAILLFLVSMIQTVLSQQYLNSMLGIGMRIRSVLIAAIYKKSLRISSNARKESSTGEIVNLMAVDAQRFMDLATSVNTIWSAPLQIILAFYFLWRELGPSVITGVAVMIILIPINGYIAHHTKILQTKQMKSKDARVKLVNEILNGIRLLKLYAWEPSFENRVVKVRNDEIMILKQASYLNASTSFILSCTPFLVSLATFATYVFVDENNILDANKAFVSISLFNIIRTPLNQLPQLISTLIQSYVSVKRINNFLNCEELDPDNVSHRPNHEYPIVIENGSFAWEKDEILKDINMRVQNGSLTAVVGTFASGKSSLISAILGEMQKNAGSVNVYGKIALVSQQAWIQNSTLQNNILFGKPLNREFYNIVTEACALLPDFEILPGGDMTEIGEKGINLSGGQKQRVSLARAIYSDADIYLLDDPLSAVDSHVGKHIFEQVIGPNGLLKYKTRLFVTHGITFLSQTNHIIVMKDGEISENGSHQELLDRKGAFAEFLMHHMHDATEEKQYDREFTVGASTANKTAIPKTTDPERVKSHTNENEMMKISNQNKGSEKGSGTPHKEGKNLIKKEKVEIGNVRWVVYKHYMECIGYPLILLTLSMYFIFQGFSIASNVWLGIWADDGDVYQNTGKRDLYLEVYGAFGFIQVITVIIANLSFTKATLDAAIKLHNLLLHNILRVPMTFFDVTPIGRILARFSSDINNVDTSLPSLLQGVLSTSVQVIGTLAIISYTTPWFLTVIVPIFLGNYGIQRVCVAITRQIRRFESISRSPIYSHFGETISGVQTIRAYSQDGRFCSESAKRVDTNHISYYCGIKAFRWMAVRLEFMGNLIILFTALFAVISKTPAAGLVGLSITYAIEVTQTLKALVRVSSNVETSIVAVERIKEYEEEPREAPWTFSNETMSNTWPEKGEIVFDHYDVRYRPGLELVLKNLNITFKGGEKVGIVGRTGSGKSSLTLSLFRVIEAAGGKIIVDGINIADIGLHSLRSRLTIIPQDPVLFAGTIRMNLDPFLQYSDDELWKALEHAHLKDFAKGLPAGLQHEIVEGGQNLSVGQRQLICLARALLKKTKILILDEATAAIDLETDGVIQKVIRSEFKECTVLTIAHRLNTILDYDRIIVLDKAAVAEFDTPSNLLQNQNSMFVNMCKDAGINF